MGWTGDAGALVGDAAEKVAGRDLHIEILRAEDGDTRKIAVEGDDKVFGDGGAAKVDLYRAETAANVGSLENLIVEIDFLFAKGDGNLFDVFAIAADTA